MRSCYLRQSTIWLYKYMHTGIGWCTGGRMFGIGTGGVVALLADLPADAVPDLVQVGQLGTEHGLRIAPDLDFTHTGLDGAAGRPGFADDVAVLAQPVRAQGLDSSIAVGRAHLQQHAEFFGEQGFERQLFTARAHLASPVFAVAHVHAAVADAVAFGHQQIHVQSHANVPGKSHFAGRRKQSTIAAVVVGQQVRAQRVHGVDQVHQVLRVVQIGHGIAHLVQGLRQDAAAHAVLALAQVHQDQRGVFSRIQLRGQRAAHIGQGGKGGDDQADGGGHLLFISGVRPLRAHGQAVFAYGDGNTQRRAQLHADGFHRGIQGRVFAGFAASGHPVGGKLDAGQIERRGQQVGNRLGHGHPARRGGVDRCQRRAFAQGHGFTREAAVVGQGHGAICDWDLPRANHLVAVAHAPHGAVADGDQETLAGHGRMGQHVNRGLLQVHAGQVHGLEGTRHGLHIAVHLGRLAQQHIHRHIDRAGSAVIGHNQLAFFGSDSDD